MGKEPDRDPYTAKLRSRPMNKRARPDVPGKELCRAEAEVLIREGGNITFEVNPAKHAGGRQPKDKERAQVIELRNQVKKYREIKEQMDEKKPGIPN